MKNRKLLLIVSLVLAMTMSLGGTLAYLTDTDGDVNTMVLGNVKITQNEQQRVEANGEFTSQLEAFEQYKMMLPVTYPGNRTEDSVTVGEYTVPLSDTEANYIDKIVSVTNDGNTDAYVRTLVAVPTGGEAWEPTAVSANDCWLHWNYPNTQEWKDSWTLNGTYTFAEINGKGYYVWEFVHKGAVEAGKTTYPVLKGFYLDQRVDTNDKGYYYVKYADDTTRVVDDFTPGETVDILVLSQAVQAGGFTDAQTALDTGFGDVTKENAEAWFGGLRKVQYVEAGGEKDQIAGEDADEIL